MKKKILLTLAIVAVFTCLFALCVSAASIEHEGIYYTTTVTDAEAKIGTATLNTSNVNCTLEIVNIPETFTYEDDITYTVIGLDASAFGGSGWPGNKIIKEVTIPKTVAKVGKHCFRNCSNLEKVTMKAAGGAYKFEDAEFYGCTSLKTVDFSEAYGLRSIGQYAFTNCPLETVLLPEGLEDIASNVFSGKSGITEIKLPSTLKKISGKQAFSSTAFSTIVLPNGLTSLGNNIFQSSQLESIVIPASVTSVGEHCFNSTSKLKYVVIANPDVTNYNNAMFYSSAVDVIFFAGTEDAAKTFAARLSKATFTNFVSYEDYLEDPDISSYKDTIVFGTKNLACGNIDTNEPATFKFTGYMDKMNYGKTCAHCGVTDVVSSVDAMFTYLGYSAIEDGTGAISIKYIVNKASIDTYFAETDKVVNFGMYAATKDALKGGDILDNEGNPNAGAFRAKMDSSFCNIELKLTGFTTEELKATKFAIGAYVEVTSGETTEYVYLEKGEKEDGDKYQFVSYNDILELA